MPDPDTADIPMSDAEPADPRTARDDDEDATNHGVSAQDPAEGADDDANEGSPGG